MVFENITHQNRYLAFCTPEQYQEQTNIMIQTQMLISNKNYIIFSYLHLMLAGLYFIKNPLKILLIGLGGGTIARALNNLLPDSELDIVEINPNVKDIAIKYFNYQPNQRTKIYIEDAVKFINDNKKYDLIINDLVEGSSGKKGFSQEKNFIQNLHASLNGNGVLVTSNYDNNNECLLKTNIKNIFNNFFELDVNEELDSNEADYHSIIITINSTNIIKKETIKQNMRYWREKFKDLGIRRRYILDRLSKALNKNSMGSLY
jgi:spermidine synthase